MRQIYSKGKLFVSNRVWFETAESVKTGMTICLSMQIQLSFHELENIRVSSRNK